MAGCGWLQEVLPSARRHLPLATCCLPPATDSHRHPPSDHRHIIIYDRKRVLGCGFALRFQICCCAQPGIKTNWFMAIRSMLSLPLTLSLILTLLSLPLLLLCRQAALRPPACWLLHIFSIFKTSSRGFYSLLFQLFQFRDNRFQRAFICYVFSISIMIWVDLAMFNSLGETS